MFRVREFGWLYLPASVLAWVIGLAMLSFAVQVFLVIDTASHSATDTLYAVFPYWAAVFLLWNWVGSRATGTDIKVPAKTAD